MSVLPMPRPSLLGAGIALSTTIAAPIPAATAQGHGAPVSYGQPYAPPWQAGARDRRALDGTPRARPVAHWESPPSAAPPIWQGLYAGVHGGWAFGDIPNGFADGLDISGAALGIHAGYNAQLGSWVLGLEADGTWTGAEGSRTFSGPVVVDAFSDWHSSLRLRAGYAFGGTLFYLTGGVAFANVDLGIASGGLEVRASDVMVGYALGGGIEMKLTPGLSARLEAIHHGFGDKSLDFPGMRVPLDLDVTTVRAGLTWQLR